MFHIKAARGYPVGAIHELPAWRRRQIAGLPFSPSGSALLHNGVRRTPAPSSEGGWGCAQGVAWRRPGKRAVGACLRSIRESTLHQKRKIFHPHNRLCGMIDILKPNVSQPSRKGLPCRGNSRVKSNMVYNCVRTWYTDYNLEILRLRSLPEMVSNSAILKLR